MRKINKIIIHCTATPEGRDFSVEQIDKWHRAKGFDRIGYHYVIGRDGAVNAGRPLEMTGAHCQGHNADSVGVCYVGGVDASGRPKDTRTQSQREAMFKLIARLKESYPHATLHGHCEFAAKACPSFNVKTDPDLSVFLKPLCDIKTNPERAACPIAGARSEHCSAGRQWRQPGKNLAPTDRRHRPPPMPRSTHAGSVPELVILPKLIGRQIHTSFCRCRCAEYTLFRSYHCLNLYTKKALRIGSGRLI